MSYKPVACEMARYNKWQNENILSICDGLGDDILAQDRGLFFSSILGTLDHILYVDQVLIRIFTSGEFASFDPTTRLSADFSSYRAARIVQDRAIVSLCDSASDDWFEGKISLESKALNRTRLLPRWFHASQMFNHQTHHRSQVTLAMHGMGIDYGNTDMPYNPLSAY